MQHRGEGQHPAGADVDQVAGRRVDSAGQVAPLRAGRGAGLLHHLERLVQAGDDPLAHPVQVVGVDRAGSRRSSSAVRGAIRWSFMISGSGPRNKRRLGEERVDPLLLLRR